VNIDPYAVLGVNKSATQDEIKKAYRQKALKDHPDRNPDDPQAEERFKLASMAYGLIGDERSRKEFDDRYRPRPRPKGRGFNDIFKNMNVNVDFGQGVHNESTWDDLFGKFQSTNRKPFAIRAKIDINLEDLVRSVEKTFVMDGQSIKFRVPAGVRDGMTIIIPLRAGQELHATINVLEHPTFTIDGDNLRCTISVPVNIAACGGEVKAETLENNVKLKISKYTDSHTKLRIKDYGLLCPDGSRGSIIYDVRLTFKTMSIEERERFADYIS